MKILLINWQDWTNPFSGGAEVYLKEIFLRLAREFDITLLCSGYKDAESETEIEGIRIIRRAERYNFNFWVYKNIRKFVKSGGYDLIIDDLNKIPFYSPYFLKGKKVLALVMHLFGSAIYREVNPVLGSYVYFTERLIGPVYRKNFFGVLSPTGKRDLIRMGIEGNRIWVIPPGVDDSVFKPANLEKTHILYTGRLKRYKGVDFIIEAIHLLKKKGKEYVLDIVGRGDDEERLKEKVKELKLEGLVRFSGYVDEETLVRKYQSAFFLVQASAKEGWGISVIEAGACGIPVIASCVPGFMDSVVDGKTGFLYPYGDVNALAEKIELLMENKQLRQQMGKENYRWSRLFTWSAGAEKMKDLIYTAVNN